ncbi:hypothetical protein OG568_56070 (plasmid) [Streptomyces sp. NBC_01450]|uniref:hypothetical protein n=1 Tax=Streptomyces sp. NBC_01450 TaxID=2903871 RepID=UPI002E2F3382|nr:hypothetical protein [Streptomyces sp. NBC_01450]
MMRFWSFTSVIRPSLTPELGGDDSLGDRLLVFTQSCGDTGERSQSTDAEFVEPVRQGCRVTGIERGGELADKVVGAAEFRAVLE